MTWKKKELIRRINCFESGDRCSGKRVPTFIFLFYILFSSQYHNLIPAKKENWILSPERKLLLDPLDLFKSMFYASTPFILLLTRLPVNEWDLNIQSQCKSPSVSFHIFFFDWRGTLAIIEARIQEYFCCISWDLYT